MKPAAAPRLRLLASVLSLLLLAAVLAGVAGWWLLRRSLPALDGQAALPGLSAAVTVERDALGVPTIRAATRIDAARALGYVHAQDRFFQMDLLRRSSAGELAELVGGAAVGLDRSARLHGFRKLAGQVLAQAPPEQRRLVEAYTAGVNAGLAALRARPFEYFLLRTRPRPWQAEDSVLVGYAMVLDLQDERGRYERTLAAVRDTGPAALFEFLAPRGTSWDAALDGSVSAPAPLPGPEIIDLRKQRRTTTLWRARADDVAIPGSNAFALPGGRTTGGGGLLANDTHLGLRVPNIWYRVSLQWSEETPNAKSPTPNSQAETPRAGPGTPNSEPGIRRTVTGITLPGLPLMIAGSNGRIAWGFTNSEADTVDIVIVEPSDIDPLFYRQGGHHLEMDQRRETILVKSGSPVDEVSRWTIWGPIIGETDRGLPLAVHWTFHNPDAFNLGLLALESASDVSAALDLAPTLGVPPLNLVVAGRDGSIGWTIAGRLPRRVGFDGRLPTVWGYGDRRWDGWLAPADYPRVLLRTDDRGAVWSANQRPVGGEAYARLGDNGYGFPARARQIRDDLAALTTAATPRALLAVQLDDRALFLERWQKLLLATLTPEAMAANRDRAELRRLVEQWNGRASTDSVAYHLVRRWRDFVASRALTPLFARAADSYEDFDFHRLNYEEPLWRLVRERPSHFLTAGFFKWDDLLLAAADDVVRWARRQDRPLARLTWGARNTASIRHPLSRALPGPLAAWLDLPAGPLPGDNNMPRVQSPDFGATDRLVVSPGREEEGIFEMPGGQSGHPLSPFYRAGHAAWVRGEATPFLPGPMAHQLILQP